MRYHATLLLLAPLLWAQGRHVRRVTPELPEPPGERDGRAGEGPPLRLLIAGDSAAAGVGAKVQQEALSGRLVEALSCRFAVHWRLCAQSGDRSGQLLDRLRDLPAERYDVAVVSIGVNDVTGMTGARVWQANLRAIAHMLRTRFGVRRICLSSIPPMHLFPALPQPLRWWLGLRARQFNARMRAVAASEPACEFVAIPYAGEHSEIARDGFHPGPRAYRLWGQHLATRLLPETAEGFAE